MAADKVRLYDLAKEMQVENKEVLAACDQHAIPYKSISSTINANDAELLRSVLTSTPRPKSPDKPAKPTPNKSQQILSINQQKPQQTALNPPPAKFQPNLKLNQSRNQN